MASITTIQSSDLVSISRGDINNNFAALNTDKVETSVIDTDTTLAANSDAKLASQKAVKAYVDAGGNVNASETTRGIVEIPTDAEVTSGAATGSTGAPLAVTPDKLATRLTTLLAGYQSTTYASGQTTYNLTTASGTQTISHGLGRTPTKVDVTAIFSGGSRTSTSTGSFTASGNSCVYKQDKITSTEDSVAGGSSTYAIYIETGVETGTIQAGIITTDSTNITITWTKTGSPSGTAYIQWNAS